MPSNNRRVRKSVKSAQVPSHARSNAATSPSPYNTTSHSHQHASQSHAIITQGTYQPNSHVTSIFGHNSPAHAHAQLHHNLNSPLTNHTSNSTIPPYSQTSFPQPRMDLTPMQRFERGNDSSCFPYHQHTSDVSPTSSPAPYNYNTTCHTSSTSANQAAQARSGQAEAGSYIDNAYSYAETQHQDQDNVYLASEQQYYRYLPANNDQDTVWGQDDLSGVGYQFGYSFAGHGEGLYFEADLEDDF